jgi:hypothetical protein
MSPNFYFTNYPSHTFQEHHDDRDEVAKTTFYTKATSPTRSVLSIKPRAYSTLLRGPPLGRQVTRERAQRAPLRLKRYRLHATVPQAIPELMQAWQRSTDITTGTGPEHLSGRGCAWPHDRVEVLRPRLLCPE